VQSIFQTTVCISGKAAVDVTSDVIPVAGNDCDEKDKVQKENRFTLSVMYLKVSA